MIMNKERVWILELINIQKQRNNFQQIDTYQISNLLLTYKLKNVEVYLPSLVYSHGQLYVAIPWANIKIFSSQGPNGYMRNVVYKEVLET